MTQSFKCTETHPNLTRTVVCYLVKGNKVTGGLRKKVSLGLGKNLFSGIGGKVGDIPGLENETYEEALAREVKEEVGVKIKEYKQFGEVIFIFPFKEKWSQTVVAYIVTDWEGELVETESIKPVTYEIDKLPVSEMWDDSKYWVPLMLKGKKLNAKFIYSKDNKTVSEKEIYIL